MQLATVFIRYGEQLSTQILDHQARHEVFRGVLLRKDEEDGRLFRAELFRVNGAVKAEHLFQLRVQKRIETRKHSRHDRSHGLFRAIECSARKPSGFVVRWQLTHQKLKVTLALYLTGFQQILH